MHKLLAQAVARVETMMAQQDEGVEALITHRYARYWLGSGVSFARWLEQRELMGKTFRRLPGAVLIDEPDFLFGELKGDYHSGDKIDELFLFGSLTALLNKEEAQIILDAKREIEREDGSEN